MRVDVPWYVAILFFCSNWWRAGDPPPSSAYEKPCLASVDWGLDFFWSSTIPLGIVCCASWRRCRLWDAWRKPRGEIISTRFWMAWPEKMDEWWRWRSMYFLVEKVRWLSIIIYFVRPPDSAITSLAACEVRWVSWLLLHAAKKTDMKKGHHWYFFHHCLVVHHCTWLLYHFLFYQNSSWWIRWLVTLVQVTLSYLGCGIYLLVAQLQKTASLVTWFLVEQVEATWVVRKRRFQSWKSSMCMLSLLGVDKSVE